MTTPSLSLAPVAISSPIYLPGDRVIYDGHPAVVICGHADRRRLDIRQRNDDLLVEQATCTPAPPADQQPDVELPA